MASRSGATRWLLFAALASLAAPSIAASDSSQVVARCGEAALTLGAVERRLAELGSAQVAALGGPGADAPRRVIEQVLALELAAELEARARRLDENPRVRDKTRELLRQAMERAIAREALEKQPVTAAEIAAYYEANRARFEQPARVRIWRILVNEEALAQRLLAEAKKAGSPSKWSELTREHSIDKATHLRQGDLGFVRADGTTDVPRVMVAPALFTAAEAVKDGEIVPNPVPENGKFAILWRRGSLPKTSRSLSDETPSIRQLLERRRTDAARKALLAKLRPERVKEEHQELLDLLPEGVLSPQTPRERLPATPHPAEAASATPSQTDRGLR